MKTVKRVFANVWANSYLFLSQKSLDRTNACAQSRVKINRRQIPIQDIRSIRRFFRSLDDDMRWQVAFISDTGMRLGEAVGLRLSDIKLDSAIFRIAARNHTRGAP